MLPPPAQIHKQQNFQALALRWKLQSFQAHSLISSNNLITISIVLFDYANLSLKTFLIKSTKRQFLSASIEETIENTQLRKKNRLLNKYNLPYIDISWSRCQRNIIKIWNSEKKLVTLEEKWLLKKVGRRQTH